MTTSKLVTGGARRRDAIKRRHDAVAGSGDLPVLVPVGNGDEARYAKTQPASFTKGLKHDAFGLASAADYAMFCDALAEGDPTMRGLEIAAGTDQRKWESPIAGVYFNDIGADPDAVAMPPAPKLGRSEQIGRASCRERV